MKNEYLKKICDLLKRQKIDAYYLSISNDHLYEFTSLDKDAVYKLTGFTGDTGSILILKDAIVLYVDGRFTTQAKTEVKDKDIKIVEVNREKKKFLDIVERLNYKGTFAFNYKIESANKFTKLISSYPDIKFVNQSKELEKIYNEIISDNVAIDNNIVDKLSCNQKKFNLKIFDENYFILDSRYVTETSKKKISYLLSCVFENGYKYYLTSSLEEIAYLTNLRQFPKSSFDDKILADAFLLVGKKKSNLYLKHTVGKSIRNHLTKNNIVVYGYDEFYKHFSKKKKTIVKDFSEICFDPSLNNYYLCNILGKKSFITSPLKVKISIKGNKEIIGFRKCNVTDGIAITKAIYDIKERVSNGESINEFDAKCIVDDYRREIGKGNYLTQSFDTIVAYKENSAICHYTPTRDKNKRLKSNSLLLIDSGGQYLSGTTDITRTISLYKNTIPKAIKWHYTLVLNSMMKLASVKFPYGLTGTELDIVARQNLYSEHIDFNHGTGHGIGYISNVHEGPNRIGPGFDNSIDTNVLEIGQVCSDEPGVYFEGKYGIRIENDLLTIYDKNTVYGDFLKFETLTLCPFDRDLIDEKYLDRDIIPTLNKYNELVYKKISKKLNAKEKKLLKYDTKKF